MRTRYGLQKAKAPTKNKPLRDIAKTIFKYSNRGKTRAKK